MSRRQDVQAWVLLLLSGALGLQWVLVWETAEREAIFQDVTAISRDHDRYLHRLMARHHRPVVMADLHRLFQRWDADYSFQETARGGQFQLHWTVEDDMTDFWADLAVHPVDIVAMSWMPESSEWIVSLAVLEGDP